MSTQHIDLVRWWSDNWIWVLILIWFFGGGVVEWLHVQAKRRRKVERRRQYRIELARAKAGLPYQAPQAIGAVQADGGYDMALPAAVIPAPPGAQPVRGVPGQCRHEKIVPVITDGGEVRKWICASWTRGCAAEFPPEIAVYEGDLDESEDSRD